MTTKPIRDAKPIRGAEATRSEEVRVPLYSGQDLWNNAWRSRVTLGEGTLDSPETPETATNSTRPMAYIGVTGRSKDATDEVVAKHFTNEAQRIAWVCPYSHEDRFAVVVEVAQASYDVTPHTEAVRLAQKFRSALFWTTDVHDSIEAVDTDRTWTNTIAAMANDGQGSQG